MLAKDATTNYHLFLPNRADGMANVYSTSPSLKYFIEKHHHNIALRRFAWSKISLIHTLVLHFVL